MTQLKLVLELASKARNKKSAAEAGADTNGVLDRKSPLSSSEAGSGKGKQPSIVTKPDADPAKDKKEKEDRDEIPAGGKTVSGEKANPVDVSPMVYNDKKINESKLRSAVFTFGRMNPPTVGHEKLVDAVKHIASQLKATPLVYLSRSEDKKKNPIPYGRKLGYARKAFGSVIKPTPAGAGNVIGILKSLNGKYDDVTMVVGSDRVAEMERLTAKYNGSEYNFQNLHIQSAGERDPDDESVGGMSASKLRAAAHAGNVSAFLEGLPAALKGLGQKIYRDVRLEEGFNDPVTAADLVSLAESIKYVPEEDYEFTAAEAKALTEKAEEYELDVEILEHIFKRGLYHWTLIETDLSHQQYSFNRVNSFIAGGAAFELDEDLLFVESKQYPAITVGHPPKPGTPDIQQNVPDGEQTPVDLKTGSPKIKKGKLKPPVWKMNKLQAWYKIIDGQDA